ncbi:MAG TPA: heavy metal translocating P-type ATPase metal-binding domain-containing protein, partial [Planctomycetota bacterium]|nr:heavy metal translocating P-type ATPase metal-binding domain-containing protein [Planctomycetota bacterium]
MVAIGDERVHASCTHCGLPVPGERRSSQFCCAGCEVVHGLLKSEGLLRFYELGGRATGAVGVVPRQPSLDWLPDLEARSAGGATTRLVLDVQGIRCAACVWLLQTLWRRQCGARDLRIDPSLGRATLTYDRGSAAAATFLAAAARFGYPMAPPGRTVARDTALLVRLGVCAAIAMNAMILAVSLYFGLGEAAGSAVSDGSLRALFGWILLGLGTLSVVVGGPVFFRAAIAGVRVGVVHMDVPISLGLLLAWAGSVYGQVTGGAVWFDTVSIFIAFMLGGRFLQQRTLARSRDQVLADDGAEHMRARRVAGGAIELVPVKTLR